ncbi:MAG: ComEC/Rec2 family competence protein [Crocinitomicaceae bacterium]
MILLATIIGVITSFYIPFLLKTSTSFTIVLICSAALVLLAIGKHTNRFIFSFVLTINFSVLAMINASFHFNLHNPLHFSQQTSQLLLVSIEEPPIEKKNSYKVVVKTIQNERFNTIGKGIIYLSKSNQSKSLEFGDILQINNRFKPITANLNPFEFDYKRYLKIHNIHHQCYLNDNEWHPISKGKNGLKKFTLRIRANLDKWITKSSLSTKNQKLAKALLLGEKEFLDKDTLKSFSSAGAMHVLAVSGLHVGIIMFVLQFFLKPIRRIRNGAILYTLLVLSGVWMYALITGLSPSVTRAAIMFSFIIIGARLQRQNTIYQSILVSAFIILLIDPFSLFKVGFQLSYLAVLGIVYIQPKLYKSIYTKNKLIDYLWQITSVSIAAQLATFPLGLYYFHQFPNLFLISNIIVIPVAGVILAIGFLFFITHSLQLFRIIFETILNTLFSLLNICVEYIEQTPFSILWGISIHWIEVFLIYCILTTFIIGFHNKLKNLIMLSLVCICVLIVFQKVEQKSIESSNDFTIYNTRKDLAIDIFNGSKNTFISSSSILKNESKLLFHIKHHWFHKRGNKQPHRIINIDSITNPILNVNQQTFLIYTNSKKPIPITDFVLLRNKVFISKQVIKAWRKNKTHIILHPDLDYRTKHFCQNTLSESSLFDISKNGAFQFNYK